MGNLRLPVPVMIDYTTEQRTSARAELALTIQAPGAGRDRPTGSVSLINDRNERWQTREWTPIIVERRKRDPESSESTINRDIRSGGTQYRAPSDPQLSPPERPAPCPVPSHGAVRQQQSTPLGHGGPQAAGAGAVRAMTVTDCHAWGLRHRIGPFAGEP